MCRGPAVRQHLLQTHVICMEAEQKIADVSPRLDTMTLGPHQDRVQHGGSWPRRFPTQEEPIFPFMAWWRRVRSLTLLSNVKRPSSV